MSTINCSLCEGSLTTSIVQEENKSFCCAGCRAVYRILEAQGNLLEYRESSLYREALRSGLIAHTADQQTPSSSEHNPHNISWHMEVEGLWCPSCAEVIHLLLTQDPGMHRCFVDYSTDIANIVFDPMTTSKEKISQRLKKFGYHLKPLEEPSQESSKMLTQCGIAAFFSMNVMMFSYPVYASLLSQESFYTPIFAWLAFFSLLPVYFYCGWALLKGGVVSTLLGALGMETLVVLGTGSAFIYSTVELLHGGNHLYFDTIGVIITFLLLGKYLEGRAKFSIKQAVHGLARSKPRRGRRRHDDGSSSFIPIDQFKIGDRLLVFAGEKIVLDGVVSEGSGSCNESMMTGEATPIIKKRGDRIVGGTFLQQGNLVIEVTAPYEQSALHHIIDYVEQDLVKKRSYRRSADAVIPWFVPAVIVIAFITYLVHPEHSFLHALSVLVVACPCALGIAAPLAESALLGNLAQKGFLVRNRAVLQTLGKETSFLFDKTGTVTEGNFAVVRGLENLSPEELKHLKGLASQSLHPLACSLAGAISRPPSDFEVFEEQIGRGLLGKRRGKTYLLGSEVFLKDHGIQVDLCSEEETPLYFACEKEVLAKILLKDPIRKGVGEAIKKLKPAVSYLVSGDAEGVVKRVASAVGIEKARWRMHPLEKRGLIEELQKNQESIAFVGDGINDAPALAAADVGITMMSGSEISIQAADVLLTTDRLDVIVEARKLAQKTRRIIRQNLFWAFLYNGLGVLCAAVGWLNPFISAGAMVLSSLIVVLNARRCSNPK